MTGLATPAQMSFLRKLYYKCSETQYSSYDIFDNIHAKYLSQDDAHILIEYKKRADVSSWYKEDAMRIIRRIESHL